MKRFLFFRNVCLTVILMFICSAYVSAYDTTDDVIVSLQINNPIMQINGIDTEIDSGRGTKPEIINGRTLVPIRAIIESFGGTVSWDATTRAVHLTMADDTIVLFIDGTVAYLNDNAEALDVPPAIINERTMLPIRFIAEGFNLGVAWDNKTQTVSIIRDLLNDTEYNMLVNAIPDYSGQPYTEINKNIPFFKDYEIIKGSFEYYSKLDELGRCGVCFAAISTDIMPTAERESINSITPTGWINATYDNVDGGYLYNRCHLIGYQLTGENANEKNLITGTRYLNIDGMLSFENLIADYIENTGNHVIYRSTPVFKSDNLLADGVLLEAMSVEDNGQDVSFCVYCYNVQPEIQIDYTTGASYTENGTATNIENNIVQGVYRTPTGKKYHFDAECGGKNSFKITLEQAQNLGLAPCAKCVN